MKPRDPNAAPMTPQGVIHRWPCSRWNADGSPNVAATLDAYEAREPLVQEVISLTRARAAGHRGVTVAAVMAAARKLAEWKP